MRWLLYLFLAVGIMLALGVGYLVYPHEIETCLADRDEATVADATVFFQFVGLGALLGFGATRLVCGVLGAKEHARLALYDRAEVFHVLMAIDGLLVLAAGQAMVAEKPIGAKVQMALGVVLLVAGLALGVRHQLSGRAPPPSE
ncbi:MAG: hypothetical protein ACYS9X_08805 [Planctomycetota bacterium]|jgi:hypothetical protein